MAIPKKIVVIGVSAGGLNALKKLFSFLPDGFLLPIVVVQHVSPESGQKYFTEFLSEKTGLKVKEAREREPIRPATVYVGPSNYHLLIEPEGKFSLSIDEKVNHSRPSIDVLFDSASLAFGPAAVGIVLTGANDDGAAGLKKIKQWGGLTIVQDPDTAEAAYMPMAAIEICKPHYVLPLEEIASILVKLDTRKL